jgi:hypothetical protein
VIGDEFNIPDVNADTVRDLVAEANAEGVVPLKSLMAMELCVLGGPRHAFFDETVAHAWLGLSDKMRKKLTASAIGYLRERELLLPHAISRDAPVSYSLSPELGVVLAARCRPSFVIVNAISGTSLRQPVLFGFGDREVPVRGIVAELPRAAQDTEMKDFAKQFGPLGWTYSYVLFSPESAVVFQADWVADPLPERPDVRDGVSRVITKLHPVGETGQAGWRMSFRGDGKGAEVETGDGQPARRYSVDELRSLMSEFIAGRSR